VSLHFVNVVAPPVVAPHGGAAARFGTNPFTAGVPLPGRPPLVLDFATSMIAQGKTRVAYNKGEAVPEGCLIDDQGRPTTDPRWSVVPPVGAILPFGLHKGSGMAVLCELLGGALAAGMAGHREDGSRRRVLNGMLTILIDPAALGDRAGFEREAASFAEAVLATPAREGFDGVRLAGDPERHCRAERMRHGVPVDPQTWLQILDAVQRLGGDADEVRSRAGAD
jgi:hydroxycarboxylate dehydrogenase B